MPKHADVLEVRLDELASDLEEVQSMLERAESRRAAVDGIVALVNRSGSGTIHEPWAELRRFVKYLLFEAEDDDVLRDRIAAIAKPSIQNSDWTLSNVLDETHRRLEKAIDSVQAISRNMADLNANRTKDLRISVNGCQKKINQAHELSRGLSSLDRSLAWEAFANLSSECRPYFSDYVDFLGGLTLRETRLDDGVSAMTDKVFEELDAARIAVPSARKPCHLLGMVNLPFPEWTMFDIPSAGYHVGLAEARSSGQSIVDDSTAVFKKDLAEQLFAEVYGAYRVGPAYAAAAIMLRLNPRGDKRLRNGPSSIDRAHVILGTLDVYHDVEAFGAMVATLRTAWKSAVDDVGGDARPADIESLERFVGKTLRLLETYRSLAPAYDPKRWRDATKDCAGLLRRDGVPVLDLLNAAWKLRLEQPDSARERAKDLMKQWPRPKPRGADASGLRTSADGTFQMGG
ncbi:MAG: hypothetical protein EOP16_00430 [Pseudonocardia sp.]|nr:MAG: hypothetical protein EOP16_00430 [Pseudonocardia sp.]